MPPRLLTFSIVLFWLATTAWFVVRDVAPQWQTGEAPPYRLGLADEAMRHVVPARWKVIRGDRVIALLQTSLRYDEKGDAFEFRAVCQELPLYSGILPFAGKLEIAAQNYRDTIRVSRDGTLQSMETTVDLVVRSGQSPEITGRAEIAGQVRDGRWHRRFRLSSDAFGEFAPELEPADPPRGSVLNPMHPIPRLTGLEPGQRWRQRLVSPHEEILQAALTKLPGVPAVGAPSALRTRFLNAEVLAKVDIIAWDNAEHDCLIVEFRSDSGEAMTARTWVRRSDGEILRQEAESHGEKLVLQRE
jgi:hypothetical protein